MLYFLLPFLGLNQNPVGGFFIRAGSHGMSIGCRPYVRRNDMEFNFGGFSLKRCRLHDPPGEGYGLVRSDPHIIVSNPQPQRNANKFVRDRRKSQGLRPHFIFEFVQDNQIGNRSKGSHPPNPRFGSAEMQGHETTSGQTPSPNLYKIGILFLNQKVQNAGESSDKVRHKGVAPFEDRPASQAIPRLSLLPILPVTRQIHQDEDKALFR